MRHRRHLCRPIIATGEQTSRTRFSQAGSTHPRCKHSFVLSFTANCKPKEPCPWWNARNLSLLISSTFFSTARISASFVFSSRQYTQPSPFPCPQANDWRMLISFFLDPLAVSALRVAHSCPLWPVDVFVQGWLAMDSRDR